MPITLKKVYFPDHRTTHGEPILNIHFKNGWSQEYVTDSWIARWKALGDGAKFEIKTETLYTEEEYKKRQKRESD